MNSIIPQLKTTVGVLTVGDPCLTYCMHALGQQIGVEFATETVTGISPFNAAFDELSKRCVTEFLIQVDEDMILYPYAVARMQEVMESAPDNVGMILFHLFDPDRNQRIHGIKIFRSAALRAVRARNIKASEMDILDQMMEVGFRWTIHPETMGRHGVLYSPETIYRRYQSMYEKDISTWNVVSVDIRRKAQAYALFGDPNDLFALLGAAQAITGAQHVENTEKNFRTYSSSYMPVLLHMLLETPVNPISFDSNFVAPPFKNKELEFSCVSWKTDKARLDSHRMELNRQDRLRPETALMMDLRVVELTDISELTSQVQSRPGDPFPVMWMGLASWNRGEYEEAWRYFETARNMGAPEWRIAWYQALTLRDDVARWSQERRTLVLDLLARVSKQQPSFQFASIFRLYLEGIFSGHGDETLIEDFFHCNLPRDRTFLELGSAHKGPGSLRYLVKCGWNDNGNRLGAVDLVSISLRAESDVPLLFKVPLEKCDPQLIVVTFENCAAPETAMRQDFIRRGYFLWHKSERSYFFRSYRTLPAPNFWGSRCLLALRYNPPLNVTLAQRVEKTLQSHEILEEVHQLLITGKMREAYALASQAAQRFPNFRELSEIEQRLALVIQNR